MPDVKSLFDLTGRVAVVTGGGRGLGLTMATALGQMGARLVLTARKAAELDAARASLTAQGVETHVFVSDLARFETVVPLVDAIAGAVGTVDILVNNAGTSWGAPAEDHPFEAWQKVVDLNLSGTWLLTQTVGQRFMIPARRGAIINIASIMGLKAALPPMQTIAYNTTKGGLISLTRQLAAEWGRYGVRVNALAPGWFPTKMSTGILAELGDRATAMPLGRLGEPADLMGAVVFLASDAAAFVTGQTLAVDGGESVI